MMPFSEAVSKHNTELVSKDMAPTTIGRTYCYDGSYTDDKLHTLAIISSLSFQGELVRHFANVADPGLKPNLYLGVGGFMNLSYISALRPRNAVFIDINPLQTVFWGFLIDAFREAKSLRAFKKATRNIEKDIKHHLRDTFGNDYSHTERSKDYVERSGLFRGHRHFKDFIADRLPDRFWVSDDHFCYLKAMAESNALGALTLDIADVDGCKAFRALLEGYDLSASIIHLSNVLTFMKEESGVDWVGRDAFSDLLEAAIRNLKLLSGSSNSTIITDNESFNLDEINRYYPVPTNNFAD